MRNLSFRFRRVLKRIHVFVRRHTVCYYDLPDFIFIFEPKDATELQKHLQPFPTNHYRVIHTPEFIYLACEGRIEPWWNTEFIPVVITDRTRLIEHYAIYELDNVFEKCLKTKAANETYDIVFRKVPVDVLQQFSTYWRKKRA